MAEKTKETPVEHRPHSTTESHLSAAASHLDAAAKHAINESGLNAEGPSLATAVAVGVGVAILEPQLIPGVLIGAGAVLAPKLLPGLGGIFRPLVKSTIKAGYSAAMAVREVVAEAGEQLEDIVAEAKAEHEAGEAGGAPRQSTPQHGPKREGRANHPPVPATNR